MPHLLQAFFLFLLDGVLYCVFVCMVDQPRCCLVATDWSWTDWLPRWDYPYFLRDAEIIPLLLERFWGEMPVLFCIVWLMSCSVLVCVHGSVALLVLPRWDCPCFLRGMLRLKPLFFGIDSEIRCLFCSELFCLSTVVCVVVCMVQSLCCFVPTDWRPVILWSWTDRCCHVKIVPVILDGWWDYSSFLRRVILRLILTAHPDWSSFLFNWIHSELIYS
jgi:hypothetical protein